MKKNKNPLAKFMSKYFNVYLAQQKGVSANTIESYKETFSQLLLYFRDVCKIPAEKLVYADFTVERIEGFLAYIETERHVSASTRNHRLAVIRSFVKFLQYQDPSGFEQCAAILSIPVKKTQSKPMNYMSLDEVNLLFSIPDKSDAAQLRDLAIMAMLYETGARVQELIDLKVASVRFHSTCMVELHGKGNKTRLVAIRKDAARLIRNYIKRCGRTDAESPLFVNHSGGKLTRAGVQYIISKYVDKARELRPELFKNKISNHCFRHTTAMHMLEAGNDLLKIRNKLGHTSVATTEIYARVNPMAAEESLMARSEALEMEDDYTEEKKSELDRFIGELEKRK